MEYITASCIISGQAVYKNGKQVFAAAGPIGTGPAIPATGPPMAAPDLLSALYRHFEWQYPKYFRMDNLSRLGFAAAEVLLHGWDASAYRPEDISIVMSNANSSLDTDYKYIATTKDIPSPGVFVYTLPNIVIGEISIRHRFKGENAFFLSTGFDAGLLTRYVDLLMRTGNTRACITGWVELLGDEHKAALFLIEEKATPDARTFSAEDLDRIFNDPTT